MSEQDKLPIVNRFNSQQYVSEESQERLIHFDLNSLDHSKAGKELYQDLLGFHKDFKGVPKDKSIDRKDKGAVLLPNLTPLWIVF